MGQQPEERLTRRDWILVVTFTTGAQQTIPEPSTVVLTCFALMAFAGLRHRKKLSTLR